MSEEQLKAFLAKAKGDSSLQEKFQAAADANAVVSIAKEAGFSISAEDLKNAQSELSEEELEGVGGSGTSYTEGYQGCDTRCCKSFSWFLASLLTQSPCIDRGFLLL